ncbi:MAG: putative rane protein [Gemmatimonadetes bacterium]|nr:putative rane protein [Gemmatimonadota bacterium]
MSLSWMMYVLFVGSAFAVGALAIDSILRRTSLPTRWVWASALSGVVSLALLAPRNNPTSPSVSLRELQGMAPHSAVALTARSTNLLSVPGRTLGALTRAFAAADLRTPRYAKLAIAATWGSLSIMLAAMLVSVSRRMNMERRTWPAAFVAGTRVRVAPSVGPAVVGLTHPEIVVPHWLLEKNADEQRLVIVHESEHVSAHDPVLMIAGWLVVALLPWHPAAWWMMSRLRLAVELDCDARVLRRGVQAQSYGSLLIDIAGQCAGHRVGAIALADRTSHLERRLQAMKHTRTRFLLVRASALAAVAALSILAACEARIPTSADVSQMDVAGAERVAARAKLLKDNGASVYVVDGMVVSADTAHAIAASRIGAMEIQKAGMGRSGRITITTIDDAADSGRAAGASAAVDERPADGVKIVTGKLLLTAVPEKGKNAPLMIIDGVIVSPSALEALNPSNISSVEVRKGESARRLYPDQDASNGVVIIKTNAIGSSSVHSAPPPPPVR